MKIGIILKIRRPKREDKMEALQKRKTKHTKHRTHTNRTLLFSSIKVVTWTKGIKRNNIYVEGRHAIKVSKATLTVCNMSNSSS